MTEVTTDTTDTTNHN